MNKRISQIIAYKTRGRKKPFAELCGWSPQYLNKLLSTGEIGLRPVTAILQALPEINARWLILGEGNMLMSDSVSDLRHAAIAHIKAVLELERYICVMDGAELEQYAAMIAGGTNNFTQAARLKWIERLAEKTMNSPANIADEAIKKSQELCSQWTAKK